MIEVKRLSKTYRHIKAVDQVSFKIEKGETLGLIGESGSGKSTLGKMILGLIQPTSGQVFFEGEEMTGRLMPKKMQMIFQDPYSSLNPRMTVQSILEEPTQIHRLPPRVDELLEQVGLSPSDKKKYPHEFSGGQRQRIVIARALALKPPFLVCDEPISSLDVTIQAQIIQLLLGLQRELQLTLLFIAHNLPIIKHLSTHVGVMFRGKLVEIGSTAEIFSRPNHPYSQLLLSSTTRRRPSSAKTLVIPHYSIHTTA
jgi:oligopeptide transport system ATP-binding protein